MRGLPCVLTALFIPSLVWAHGGSPAVADLTSPRNLCPVTDRSTAFTWVDADSPAPSGAATIDFYATRTLPPTFTRDVFPPELEETIVARGILEPDLTNQMVWDTSTVATGVYWLWSRVNEPPEEMSAQLIGLSPVPVVVHHPGDAFPPAIAITRPNSAFAVADQTYRVEYQALEATGTGRVRLEAKPFTGDTWYLVADRLPAGVDGTYQWNTADLELGDWMMRATLTDCFGHTAVAHTRFIFNVSHPGQPVPDAGTPDAGTIDALVPDWCDELPADAGLDQCGVTDVPSPRDAGVSDAGVVEEPTGCDCTVSSKASNARSPVSLFGLLAALFGALALSRASTSRRHTRRRSTGYRWSVSPDTPNHWG